MQLMVEDGEKLFQVNCVICYGFDLQGIVNGLSFYGVGELVIEFQLLIGCMLLQMQGLQVLQKVLQFMEDQIFVILLYVQFEVFGLIFFEECLFDGEGDVVYGVELFCVNCVMCYNVVVVGGVFIEGKYVFVLIEISVLYIYVVMVIGLQNMLVFGDMNLFDEDKCDIILVLFFQQQFVQIGGFLFGLFGLVFEGLFVWIFGIGVFVVVIVWIMVKFN